MRQPSIPLDISLNPQVEQTSKAALPVHKHMGIFRTAWHRHSKAQLLYAEQGVTQLYTPSGSFLLPARHCAWIPADVVHQVASSSPSLFLRTLYFAPDAGKQNEFYEKLSVFQVNDLLREMILYTAKWTQTTVASETERQFLRALRLVLPELKGQSLQLRLPAPKHPRLQAIIPSLLERLQERTSMEELARKAGVSIRTLTRLFQRELGMPYTSFLKVARISKSLELLSQPGANVGETAFLVGYDSLPSFSNAFLELVGSRPHHFLQRH